MDISDLRWAMAAKLSIVAVDLATAKLTIEEALEKIRLIHLTVNKCLSGPKFLEKTVLAKIANI